MYIMCIVHIYIYSYLLMIYRRQEEISAEREEIDRQKKLLSKKRPTNSETGRKRAGSQSSSSNSGSCGAGPGGPGQSNSTVASGPPGSSTVLHNGTDNATFLKPDALPGFSQQEYYEADEILKVS